MGLLHSFDDILNLLIRRRQLILTAWLICLIASVWVIAGTRKEYRAFAAIQVEGPQVQNPGTDSSGSSNAAQIMQSIQNRLTTRENLLLIIDRHGLFADRPNMSPDERVSELRKSIQFETIAGAPGGFGGQSSISGILITASMGDPELAARIANDLAQSVLDMSNEGTATRARDTYAFFAGEEERIRTDIVTQEAKLATYQKNNKDSLPVLAEARQQEIAELDSELRALEQSVLELTAENARLDAQGTLRETDRRRQEELLSAISLQGERREFAQKRRDDVEASLSKMPEVEQAIAALERELILLQDRYSSVSQSLAQAETALFLAERQQSERFMLLDRAVTPENSVGPGLRKMAVAAAFGSLIAAMLLALAMELAFPVVRTTAQLERAMGAHVLGSIPEVPGLAHRSSGFFSGNHPELTLWNILLIALLAGAILLITSGIS